MACGSCGTGGCSSGGCKNSGLCASGSCNKMNSYDWISTLDYDDPSAYEYVEVSFKNGARKDFYKNPNNLVTGDQVLVEVSGGGFDIGVISLSGELVRHQMKKKSTQEDKVLFNVIRRANERDLEKLENKIEVEREAMISARAIARSLGLELKIGDVEYQGDMKKATFFFTAVGRVDFRELVRAYAKEFKVKIEMRQIGSRQESARIGGIGSCGRELCCSTWLADFKSVNTTAARYQNIAINQTKLSGQCGRLKCCLNYELDSYVDALQHFPNNANSLMTKKGKATLVKTDIFKGLMFYVYEDISMRGVFHPLDKEKVKEILAMNKKGIHPEDLTSFTEIKEEEKEIGFADVTGEIELPNKKKKKKKSKGGPKSDSTPGQEKNIVDNQNNPAPKPQNNQGKPNQPQQQRNNQQNKSNDVRQGSPQNPRHENQQDQNKNQRPPHQNNRNPENRNNPNLTDRSAQNKIEEQPTKNNGQQIENSDTNNSDKKELSNFVSKFNKNKKNNNKGKYMPKHLQNKKNDDGKDINS